MLLYAGFFVAPYIGLNLLKHQSVGFATRRPVGANIYLFSYTFVYTAILTAASNVQKRLLEDQKLENMFVVENCHDFPKSLIAKE